MINFLVYIYIYICALMLLIVSVINADKHILMDPDLAVRELVILAGFI